MDKIVRSGEHDIPQWDALRIVTLSHVWTHSLEGGASLIMSYSTLRTLLVLHSTLETHWNIFQDFIGRNSCILPTCSGSRVTSL